MPSVPHLSHNVVRVLLSWVRTDDLLPRGPWFSQGPEHSGLSGWSFDMTPLPPRLAYTVSRVRAGVYITTACVSALKANKITSICEATLLFPLSLEFAHQARCEE